MALTLGLNLGQDLYIGDNRVAVKHIESPTSFDLSVAGQGLVRITDECSTELFPGVKVQAGMFGTTDTARLVITAPREVKVLRGRIYRREVKCQQ